MSDLSIPWESKGVLWERPQRRAYNLLRPLLEYALSKGFLVRWVTLTSSPDSDASLLWVHHRKLCDAVQKKIGHRPCYVGIETGEGHGVLHVFWFFDVKDYRKVFVPYDWLSAEWKRLHKAWHVNIEAVGGRGNDAIKVSRYACSQYAAGQSKFICCRSSRKLPGDFRPARMFSVVRSYLRDKAWPLPWRVKAPEIRAAVLSLMLDGYFIHDDNKIIMIDGALVIV